MKLIKSSTWGILLLFAINACQAQEVPELDWSEIRKTEPYKASEQWNPVPEKVTPGYYTSPPSDAIVLFDGKNLSKWHKPKYGYGATMQNVKDILKVKINHPSFTPAEWIVKDGL